MKGSNLEDQFGIAVIEHLGPNALAGGKISIYDAFQLGWNARGALQSETRTEKDHFNCNGATRCSQPCGDCTQAWPKPESEGQEASA